MSAIFPVRPDIPFGKLRWMEIFVILVEGQMPDGTKINRETQQASLSRVLPMMLPKALTNGLYGDIIAADMNRKPNDPDTIKYNAERAEFKRLVKEARAILGDSHE